MSKPVENLYKSLFVPKLTAYANSKLSASVKNYSFAIYFMHLKLRKGHKADCVKVGESTVGIRL